MVCRGYMVDRHCVWCLMVGSITWDNVQNESHGLKKKNENMCVGHSKLGVDLSPLPQGERPCIEVRHDH